MLCEIETLFDDLILRVSDETSRLIEGMIVPWDKPAPVMRPIPGMESYKRGALDKSLALAKWPIPLLTRHAEAEPAAVVVEHDNRDDGHYAIFRALRTRSGDDALELISEGVYRGLSIGGTAVPARTTIRRGAGGRQMIERAEIKLDHVGLVRTPAFEDAQVLALRHADDWVDFDVRAAAEARKRIRQRLRTLTTSEV